jgi:N-acyl homoserine lactone hydrolase
MPIDHSIWSFAYAQGRLPADFMGGCPVCSNQGMVDIPMVYSLVTTGAEAARARTIVVDTGFKGGQSMTGRKFENIEMPAAILGKVGYRPEDVDTVVLTHMHFDHAGNFDAFPNARFVVQRMEYERWQQVIASLPDLSVGKSSWMLSSLAQDTHTFGSQWLEIATKTGPYVIAGDCVYWYANVERMWPPGYVQGNTWNLMQAYERLRKVVGPGHLERIIPGHDGEIFTRHRSWTAGLNSVAEVHLAQGERSRAKEGMS